jgi:hypothetical protein
MGIGNTHVGRTLLSDALDLVLDFDVVLRFDFGSYQGTPSGVPIRRRLSVGFSPWVGREWTYTLVRKADFSSLNLTI